MIPAYNEEECVAETARELVQEFQKLGQKFELILIDHASTDSTYAQLNKVQQEYPDYVRLVQLAKNIGYGGIINQGLREYTQGEIIGWTCADGEVKAEDTRKLLEFLIHNPAYAAVKASRIQRNRGFRKFISAWYNRLALLLFAIKTEDINGWPFFVRSAVYNDLDIRLKNWVINIEILHKLQQRGLSFQDLACIHQQRKGSRSKVHLFTIFSFLYQVLSYKVSAYRPRFGNRKIQHPHGE